jgi:hypothetical protein
MLRIPHCLDNRLTDGGKIVSPTHRQLLYSPETLFLCFWYSCLLEAEYTPGPSPSVFPPVNVRDQVSHPYRTTDKIIVLHVLIVTFLDRGGKNRRFCNNGSRITRIQSLDSVKPRQCYVRFEVFTAVTMKIAVFWDIKTQFVRHRRHITSPLQSPAG